jgi:predicted NBD/HSP70 family sugar kinase
MKQAAEGINKGEATLINNLAQKQGNLTAKIIYEAALKKDKLATRIIQKTGYYLGLGLVNLVNLLNPEVIVIGGDISQVADILLKPVKEVVFSRALSAPAKRAKILASHFGKNAGILGSATLFLESVFQIPEIRLSSRGN